MHKIENGFTFNGKNYLFDGQAEVLNNTQAHIPTNQGILLIDTTIKVDNNGFATIEQLIDELYK
jgi:hypothetical protein